MWAPCSGRGAVCPGPGGGTEEGLEFRGETPISRTDGKRQGAESDQGLGVPRGVAWLSAQGPGDQEQEKEENVVRGTGVTGRRAAVARELRGGFRQSASDWRGERLEGEDQGSRRRGRFPGVMGGGRQLILLQGL